MDSSLRIDMDRCAPEELSSLLGVDVSGWYRYYVEA
jgi:hypothetical protein